MATVRHNVRRFAVVVNTPLDEKGKFIFGRGIARERDCRGDVPLERGDAALVPPIGNDVHARTEVFSPQEFCDNLSFGRFVEEG